jgi:hypothetical protein
MYVAGAYQHLKLAVTTIARYMISPAAGLQSFCSDCSALVQAENLMLLSCMALLQNLTKDDIFKANALGWCIEWVSSSESSSSSSMWRPTSLQQWQQHWQALATALAGVGSSIGRRAARAAELVAAHLTVWVAVVGMG